MSVSWLGKLNLNELRLALNEDMDFYQVGNFNFYDKSGRLLAEDAKNLEITDDLIISTYGAKWVRTDQGNTEKRCYNISFNAFGSVDLIKAGFSDASYKGDLTKVLFKVMKSSCKDEVIDGEFYEEAFFNYHRTNIENKYNTIRNELDERLERLNKWHNESIESLNELVQSKEEMGE